MTTEPSARNWTVITVTYNSESHLRRWWPRVDFGSTKWIVVDNASTDDSAPFARSLGARVIEMPKNIGFAAANNLGLARVETSWTAFINPDVAFGNSTDLERLAEVSKKNSALVAPQLLNPDGSEQPNGRGLPYLLDKLAHRSVVLPGSRLGDYVRQGFRGPTYVAWVIGAAMTGPTRVFRDLGGWNEEYFVYYEDHEIGLRAWSAGVPVVLDPCVRWTHEWQRATSRAKITPWRNELRSAWVFYRTHPGFLARRGFKRFRVWDQVDEKVWTPAHDV